MGWFYVNGNDVENTKNINELLSEVYAIAGDFVCERKNIYISKKQINQVLNGIAALKDNWNDMTIEKMNEKDVYKLSLTADDWGLIRPSSKEAAIRVYVHAASDQLADEITRSLLTLVKQYSEES